MPLAITPNVKVVGVKFKSNPATYRHKDLPHGKDLHGEKLQSALTNIFNDYCTDAVAEKLAPMTNSQRNEALNSVIGSKNPKIRFYGGSESNDFLLAYGDIKSTRGLKIAHLNIRSLANKTDSLRLEGITNKTFDVLTLSETWLDSSTSDAEIKLPGFVCRGFNKN